MVFGKFLRKAIAPEVQQLLLPAPRTRGRLGYRLGTSIIDVSNARRTRDKRRKRRQVRAISNEARRLNAMKHVLPPPSGSRRPEFSSPIVGRWASPTGEQTSLQRSDLS